MPYSGEAKVEYPIGGSDSLPPGLVPGRDRDRERERGGEREPKIGLFGKGRTENTNETRPWKRKGKRPQNHREGEPRKYSRTRKRTKPGGNNRMGPKRLGSLY